MKRSPKLSVLLAIICACLAASALRVSAQAATEDATLTAARMLGEHGIEAYWDHDYVAANDSLEKAFRLFATPTLGLWSARARVSLGRLVEAAERYREALQISESVGDRAAQQKAQEEAARELAELQLRIPTLKIALDLPASQVAVRLDGIVLSSEQVGTDHPVNPGDHRVEVMAGGDLRDKTVSLAERDHKLVRFELAHALAAAASSAPARAQHGFNYVPLVVGALVLGGVGLATSGVTALVANGKCPSGECATDADKSSYSTLRTVTAVSFWTGSALSVAGLATWFLAPTSSDYDERAKLRWDVGPTGVVVRGAF